ncbi:hypothetical protein P167DRAFT_574371 [Morchella conica CCBAS932]|uniref:Uncharacterized protein n=1 Tax=Morchella conica CCBAS932 TaxID=1392247 RepID=A0A3N4KSR7_9PEZI|nr:hypothetical protein P167DRAFT_574371 [Morchella conica CCBAS932]
MDTKNHSTDGYTTGNGLSGTPVNRPRTRQTPQHTRHASFSSRGKFSMDLSARLSRISIKHDRPKALGGIPRTEHRLSQRSSRNKNATYGVDANEFTSALRAKLEKVQEEQNVLVEDDPAQSRMLRSRLVKLVKVREDQRLLEESDSMAPALSSSHPVVKGKMLKDHKHDDIDAAKKEQASNDNNNEPEEFNSIVVRHKRETTFSNANKAKKHTTGSLSHTAEKQLTIQPAGDKDGGTSKENVRMTRAAAKKQIHATARKTRATMIKQTHAAGINQTTRATTMKQTRAVATKRPTRATTVEQTRPAATEQSGAVPTEATAETEMKSIANFTCKCGSDYILLARFLKHQKTCTMGMKKLH